MYNFNTIIYNIVIKKWDNKGRVIILVKKKKEKRKEERGREV